MYIQLATVLSSELSL